MVAVMDGDALPTVQDEASSIQKDGGIANGPSDEAGSTARNGGGHISEVSEMEVDEASQSHAETVVDAPNDTQSHTEDIATDAAMEVDLSTAKTDSNVSAAGSLDSAAPAQDGSTAFCGVNASLTTSDVPTSIVSTSSNSDSVVATPAAASNIAPSNSNSAGTANGRSSPEPSCLSTSSVQAATASTNSSSNSVPESSAPATITGTEISGSVTDHSCAMETTSSALRDGGLTDQFVPSPSLYLTPDQPMPKTLQAGEIIATPQEARFRSKLLPEGYSLQPVGPFVPTDKFVSVISNKVTPKGLSFIALFGHQQALAGKRKREDDTASQMSTVQPENLLRTVEARRAQSRREQLQKQLAAIEQSLALLEKGVVPASLPENSPMSPLSPKFIPTINISSTPVTPAPIPQPYYAPSPVPPPTAPVASTQKPKKKAAVAPVTPAPAPPPTGPSSSAGSRRINKPNPLYEEYEYEAAADRARRADPQYVSKKHRRSLDDSNSDGEGDLDPNLSSAQRGRMKNSMKHCQSILRTLMTHRWAGPFNIPVDPVALGIPDYPKIIKQPMDFGTIKRRLDGAMYTNTEAFADDCRLVFQNAMLFNPKGTEVHIMAEALAEAFEKRYKQIPKVDERPHAVQAKKYKELEDKLRKMEENMLQLQSQNFVQKRPGGARNARDNARMDVPLTFEEKRALSVNINRLPNEKLGRVVQIIRESMPNLSERDDEIEIDIDNLDTRTLRQLDKYVKDSLGLSKQRTGGGGGGAGRLRRGNISNARRRKKPDASQAAVSTPAQKQEHSSSSDSSSDSSSNDSSSSSSDDSDDDDDKMGIITVTPAPKPTTPAAAATAAVPPAPAPAPAPTSHPVQAQQPPQPQQQPAPVAAAPATTPAPAPAPTPTAAAPLVPQQPTTIAALAADAPKILPTSVEKSELRLQNQASWAKMSDAPQQPQTPTATSGDPNLWSQFRTQDALQKQLQKEREEEEERQRAQRAAAAEEARLAAQRREAAKVDQVHDDQEAEKRRLEELREAERRKRAAVVQTVELTNHMLDASMDASMDAPMDQAELMGGIMDLKSSVADAPEYDPDDVSDCGSFTPSHSGGGNNGTPTKQLSFSDDEGQGEADGGEWE